MNHIHNLMLRLLGDAVEEDFNVSLTFSNEYDKITITHQNTIWFEIDIMSFYDVDEPNAIEIINYECDEFYHYLDEDTAFEISKNLIASLYLSDDE